MNNIAVKLAIVSSHPIQYNAPLFRMLTGYENIDLHVFYNWEGTANKVDPEFGREITWDIPLLTGYSYEFVKNRSKKPGTHHFLGLDNPQLVTKIENWNPDAILVYGWAFKSHLNVLRYFAGRIPIYFRGDSTLLTDHGWVKKQLRKWWLTWVYKHVDAVFYPGVHSRNYFLNNGVSAEKLIHVPHAIDNSRFMSKASEWELEAAKIRKQLNISDQSLVLLFAGKFVPRKQPEFLLRAVKELVQEQFKVDLLFVGTGPLHKLLLEQSKDCPFIHFLGFKNQSQMPLIYRMGDVYVLPSNIETWGLGVNEAMASSRPVIVSNLVGCAPDLVRPNISGSIFLSSCIEALKTEIRHYCNNQLYVNRMKKSSNIFIQDSSFENAAVRMLESFVDKRSDNSL